MAWITLWLGLYVTSSIITNVASGGIIPPRAAMLSAAANATAWLLIIYGLKGIFT